MVIIGSLLIVACMFLFLEFKPVPGAFVGWAANLSASLLVVVFGFLFVTVSSRIVGLVGVVGESGVGHDDCDADGDDGGVSGAGVDGAGIWSAGDHDWRRGVHCGFELGGYFAGFEDRVHYRGDAAGSSRLR